MSGTTAKIYTSLSSRLLKFIRSKVSRLEDAEDILQDVFYKYSSVDTLLNPIENAAAWLYRASRNKIIDYYKKKEPWPVSLLSEEDGDEDDAEGDVISEIADIIYGEEATPETEHFRALVFEEIQAALAELPAAQREVFEMSELLDYSVNEIAEKTNTPVNTVLSRKHYAVKFLRSRLAELYYDVCEYKRDI